MQTVMLWRPVGPKELALIKASGMKRFPPRLPEQPIFYPVTTEDYAIKIARDWNVTASGAGFVTRFEVRRDFLDRYDVQVAGGRAQGILDSSGGPRTIQRRHRGRGCRDPKLSLTGDGDRSVGGRLTELGLLDTIIKICI